MARFTAIREAGAQWPSLILLALPVTYLLTVGWHHRWLADDGFINVRVVQQLLEGNGPVFNVGERVEVTTSPGWLYLLVLARFALFFLRLEWIAVVLGLALTGLALVLTEYACVRLYRTWRVVPVGLIVFAALPPAADYSTSGLENPLSYLWIAASQMCLIRALGPSRPGAPWASAVIGLGVLVRPDLAIMVAVFAGALLWVVRPTAREFFLRILPAGLALPLAYQVFRMGYFGALLPNTAYAKEALSSHWRQGWWYLTDFSDPYRLWIPAGLLIVATSWLWRHCSARWLPIVTPVLAGLLHGFFVVRGGGDFMHGRMLLAALFACLVPFFALPFSRATAILAAATLIWSAVPIRAGGPPYKGIGPHWIDHERRLLVDMAHHTNPVTLEDFSQSGLFHLGEMARRQTGEARPVLLVFRFKDSFQIPFRGGHRGKGGLGIAAVGVAGTAAGTDVVIADQLGLANPVGARLKLGRRGRPGHEKILADSWTIAMYAEPGSSLPAGVSPADVEAARRALDCPEIRALLARSTDPLTGWRFLTNVVESVSSFGLRIDPDPKVAARCGEAL